MEDMPKDLDKGSDKTKSAKRPERTQIMTPKEAAKYLGFHLVTVYRLLKKEKSRRRKLADSGVLRKNVLDAWLTSRMNQS